MYHKGVLLTSKRATQICTDVTSACGQKLSPAWTHFALAMLAVGLRDVCVCVCVCV